MNKNASLNASDFASRLIQWYHHHHRDLPWRRTTDPYAIWLSEVILQQTRVAQGLPYYQRFIDTYPTVFDLALAEQQEVLRLWQGLGYYSRARNMHATARQVVEEYGGVFPDRYSELVKLKGVGEYTAAAIASFAFGEAVPAIDGNVYRVLARIFGIFTDITRSAARKEFMEIANKLIPPDDAATFNQAMIEFGAIQCQPVAPDCLLCPFNTFCYAFDNGAQALLPVKSKKMPVRERYFNYIVFECNDRLAMKQRSERDVWQGLYDFHLVETAEAVDDAEGLLRDGRLPNWATEGMLMAPQKTYVHLLTHQKLHVQFWHFKAGDAARVVLPEPLTMYGFSEIDQLPKPILIDNFIKERFFS